MSLCYYITVAPGPRVYKTNRPTTQTGGTNVLRGFASFRPLDEDWSTDPAGCEEQHKQEQLLRKPEQTDCRWFVLSCSGAHMALFSRNLFPLLLSVILGSSEAER